MKILIAGSSGFIGSHLTSDLEKRGHQIVSMTRRRSKPGVVWNPDNGTIDKDKLEGFDVIINLAGESVAERWTDKRKKAIYDSRINGTKLIASAIASMSAKPKLFLCASAIGYYGERGSEVLTENSTAGDNFLAKVCFDWEAATKPVADAGVRTVNLRFGIVLSTTGGAFPRMSKPFQMGAGGRLGTGKQYMSWIAIDDTISAIRFIMENESIHGPVNIVSPSPVTNNEFTQVLGHVLHMPTMMPVPVTMAHLAFGTEMADGVLLASDRVLPEKLGAAGFTYGYPELEPAFKHILHDHS